MRVIQNSVTGMQRKRQVVAGDFMHVMTQSLMQDHDVRSLDIMDVATTQKSCSITHQPSMIKRESYSVTQHDAQVQSDIHVIGNNECQKVSLNKQRQKSLASKSLAISCNKTSRLHLYGTNADVVIEEQNTAQVLRGDIVHAHKHEISVSSITEMQDSTIYHKQNNNAANSQHQLLRVCNERSDNNIIAPVTNDEKLHIARYNPQHCEQHDRINDIREITKMPSIECVNLVQGNKDSIKHVGFNHAIADQGVRSNVVTYFTDDHHKGNIQSETSNVTVLEKIDQEKNVYVAMKDGSALEIKSHMNAGQVKIAVLHEDQDMVQGMELNKAILMSKINARGIDAEVNFSVRANRKRVHKSDFVMMQYKKFKKHEELEV